MKKILIWMTAILLTVLIVLPVTAEEAAETTGPSWVAVLYFPVRDSAKAATARYLVKVLAASQKNAEFQIAGVQSANVYGLDRVSDAIKGDTSWSGTISERVQSKVLDAMAQNLTDLWLLIPEETEADVLNHDGISSWIRSLLDQGGKRVHLILIGDGATLPGEGTLLGALINEREDQFECILSAGDFLASERSDATRERHTGDYLIASLAHGSSPVDLPLRSSEDGKKLLILPQDEEIFLLTRWTGDEPGISLKNRDGSHVNISAVMEIRADSPRGTSFKLWKSTRVQRGEYSVDGAGAESVKAYWYPDLDEVLISADIPSPFKHGNNTVSFSLSEDFERPEAFTVGYRYSFNGDVETTVPSVPYDAEKNAWAVEIKANTDKTDIRITPFFLLNMGDGNQILARDGDSEESGIENVPVSVQEGALTELNLYLDNENNQQGSVSFTWQDFLKYNQEDEEHRFEIIPEEGRDEVDVRQNGDGFVITAKRETEAGNPLTLSIKCDGEEKCTVAVSCTDLKTLIGESIHVSSEQNGKTMKPEDTVTVSVSIDETLESQLKAAGDQHLSNLPNLEELLIILEEGDWSQTILLSEPQENRQAVYTVRNEKKTDKQIAWSLRTGTEGRKWNEGSVDFSLKNDVPQIARELEPTVKIPLSGFFGSFETVDLLEKALGSPDLISLFTDEETKVESVRLIISGADEQEDSQVPPAEHSQTEYPYSLGPDENGQTVHGFTQTSSEDAPQIETSVEGQYILTLTASDGVNESEPVKVQVRVYSTLIRYLIYAGIALAALLVILIVILIIRQKRKPSFERIQIRCLASSDDDQDRNKELIGNSNPVPLTNFGKQEVSLQTALILTGQPPLSEEGNQAAKDIVMLPTHHDELKILFGKTALQVAGRQGKKEILAQGNLCRIRLGNMNVLIENSRKAGSTDNYQF